MFFHQLRISGQIGKQDGHVTPLAQGYDLIRIRLGMSIGQMRHRPGGGFQSRAALAAKFAAGRIGGPAKVTERFNRATALSAKFCINPCLGSAVGALHKQTFGTVSGTNGQIDFMMEKDDALPRYHCHGTIVLVWNI
jgi:hypothetical protein